MADRASADRVAADMQPPNYRAAIKRIRTAIVQKQTRIQSINGEISDEWAKIEGHRVNKKAARIFAMLDKLAPEERKEIVISLNGLIDMSEWDRDVTDLVDKAEGNVVQLHVGPKTDDDEGGDDEDGDDGDDAGEAEMREVEEAVSEEAAPRKSRRTKTDSAKVTTDIARRADARREEMREKLNPQPKPHDGDDTDLAQP